MVAASVAIFILDLFMDNLHRRNCRTHYDGKASLLRFENVSVVFDDGAALDDISFDVGKAKPGSSSARRAAEKTVLLKTAMGAESALPTGHVYLFDEDVNARKVRLFNLRSKIGMPFQESALFDSMTIAQNVAYPLLNQKADSDAPRQNGTSGAATPRASWNTEQTMDRYPSELSEACARAAIARGSQ